MLVYNVLIKKLNTDKMTMGYGHHLKCYKFIAGQLVMCNLQRGPQKLSIMHHEGMQPRCLKIEPHKNPLELPRNI